MENIRQHVLGQRRSGRTTRMIEALPDDGDCVVVGWTAAHRLELRRAVDHMRGVGFVKFSRFVILIGDQRCDQLRGLRVPIWADHYVWEQVRAETRATLRMLGVKGEEHA